MKIKLTGKYLEDIKGFLEEQGHILTEDNPELIVTHGGDGALLGAEREFPGIPKFPIRDKHTAPLCREHCLEKQLKLFFDGKLKKTELMKLRGECNGKSVSGINDVFIHNKNRINAVRYCVWIDDELYGEEIVGDGAGVATVHGSTAYYRSITHSIFRVGVGLAFSNSTELTNHLVLPEDSIIKIQITRGPAVMVADNSPELVELNEGDIAVISKNEEKAVVYGLDIFMCPKCRILRHSKKLRSAVVSNRL